MVRARIFRRWIHYLHEPPSTPIFLPAKAVLIATILVVFSIVMQRNNMIALRFLPMYYFSRALVCTNNNF